MKRVFLLSLLLAFSLCACSKQPQQPPAPTVQQLPSPLTLSAEEDALVLCCEENRALLAVGHRNGALEGPLYNTDYLLRWNYTDGTSDKVPIQSQAYITSAVFDGSDLLYVDYESSDARIAWSLVRYTEAGKTTLASGQADSYDRVPALFTLDKHPMYLLADDSGLSVFRVEGGKVSAVLTVPDCTMSGGVAVCSNGRQYAFLAAVNGSPHCTVFICDGSGILRQKELSKPVTTFAITDDYVVCGLGAPDTAAFSCESISIGSGNTTTADSATPMWRLAGSGNSCLYVDGSFASYIFYPNTQQTNTLTISRDTAVYQNWPTLFFSDGAGGYLLQMDIENTDYFWHITT